MIKVDNVFVYNIANAVHAARNPLNSWDQSDSDIGFDELGAKDLELAKKLCKAGSSHRKFLRQIMVSIDITAPLYFWKEFDTYKIGTTANSCSTMHTIHKKKFTLDDFSTDHLGTLPVSVNEGKQNEVIDEHYDFLYPIEYIVQELNMARNMFLQTKDKKFWYTMIQLLPSSYNQMRTITMNYENIMNMIEQRKGHKLDEWNEFVEKLMALPYVEELYSCING